MNLSFLFFVLSLSDLRCSSNRYLITYTCPSNKKCTILYIIINELNWNIILSFLCLISINLICNHFCFYWLLICNYDVWFMDLGLTQTNMNIITRINFLVILFRACWNSIWANLKFYLPKFSIFTYIWSYMPYMLQRGKIIQYTNLHTQLFKLYNKYP